MKVGMRVCRKPSSESRHRDKSITLTGIRLILRGWSDSEEHAILWETEDAGYDAERAQLLKQLGGVSVMHWTGCADITVSFALCVLVYVTVPGAKSNICTVHIKRCHFIFNYDCRVFWWIFYKFCTWSRNEFATITCRPNLLTSWLDDVITARRVVCFIEFIRVKNKYVNFRDKIMTDI